MGNDPTEGFRKNLVTSINSQPEEREKLEGVYGKEDVFDTDEVGEKFEITSFLAPFAIVRRKSDGVKGILMFQDTPRFYFNFRED